MILVGSKSMSKHFRKEFFTKKAPSVYRTPAITNYFLRLYKVRFSESPLYLENYFLNFNAYASFFFTQFENMNDVTPVQ